MPAAVDRPGRTAPFEREKGVWFLRAGAIAEPDGSVTLLVAAGMKALEAMIVDPADASGYVDTGVFGVDSAAAIVMDGSSPLGERMRPRDTPANMRLQRIVFLSDVDDGSSPPALLDIAEDVLLPLVAASLDLRTVPRPLSRIAKVVADCTVGHLSVTDVVTMAELRSAATGPLREFGGKYDGPGSVPMTRKERVGHESDLPPLGRKYYRGTALDSISLGGGRCAVLLTAGAEGRLHVLSDEDAMIWQRADGVDRSTLGGTDDEVSALLKAQLLDFDPSWRIAGDVAWVDENDRTTVLGPSANVLPLALEGSAHVIWTFLADQGAMRQDQLVKCCIETFDVSAQEIIGPIDSLLHDLSARGLVSRV